MNNTDLAEIRARLRAAAEDRRPAPRGPLGSLRGWLGPKRRPPLLGAPLPYEPRPAPASRRPAPDETGEEALPLDQPLDLPVRRNAFGQRPEPGEEPRPAVCIAPLTAAPPQVDDDDMIEAIRRRPSPLLRRIEEATETPFLPEDLADASGDDLERLYSEAGLAPLPRPARSGERGAFPAGAAGAATARGAQAGESGDRRRLNPPRASRRVNHDLVILWNVFERRRPTITDFIQPGLAPGSFSSGWRHRPRTACARRSGRL